MVIKCISLISVIMGLKCYNCNKVYNEYNLFGLRLRFESHIPEHVVDQMNNILVQYENLFVVLRQSGPTGRNHDRAAIMS